MGQFERSLWVAPKSSYRHFGWFETVCTFGSSPMKRDIGSE